jgi:predicted secreted Zn-dependent protease
MAIKQNRKTIEPKPELPYKTGALKRMPFKPESLLTASELPGLRDSVPKHGTAQRLRQSAVLRQQEQHGNAFVQRFLEHDTGMVQRKKKKASGKSEGKGPGKINNAKEEFYDVSGATLDEISPQLHPFDGHASETYTALTIEGEVKPTKTKDDTYQAKVKWIIVDGVVRMPRWTDYAAACPAAQAEWDRFMRLLRQHEQEAHVNVSASFVKELGEADTVITGETMADIQDNLVAKQEELGARLQAIHDGCDHGVGLDAILHPDNGRCEDE